MRVASRVIGTALAAGGLFLWAICFFALSGWFDQKSVLAPWRPDPLEWKAAGISFALGAGLLLAGWYYLRLDVDRIDGDQERRPSRLASYFVRYRREIKVVAQVGLALSLARFALICFGVDWPGSWAKWALLLLLICLMIVCGRGWEEPGRLGLIPGILWKTLGAAALLVSAAIGFGIRFHHPAATRTSEAALIAILFSLEVLSLTYGCQGQEEKEQPLKA